jgi:hypothetical protein
MPAKVREVAGTGQNTQPLDFRRLVADLAEAALRNRFKVERTELVGRVLEALVVDVLRNDERFHAIGGGGFWMLSARVEELDLARRRKEEADAEQAAGSVARSQGVYGAPTPGKTAPGDAA